MQRVDDVCQSSGHTFLVTNRIQMTLDANFMKQVDHYIVTHEERISCMEISATGRLHIACSKFEWPSGQEKSNIYRQESGNVCRSAQHFPRLAQNTDRFFSSLNL